MGGRGVQHAVGCLPDTPFPQAVRTRGDSALLRGFSYARDALRALLNCSGLQEVDVILKRKNCWNQFSHELFHHYGVYLVAK